MKRILLMDDEQMVLDLLSRMLGHLGYEVTTCTEGKQAVAAFTRAQADAKPFDVVMVDMIIVTGMDGQQAAAEIKKLDPKARLIATSGHLDHPVMVDYRSFGFNAKVEKPYKLEKLKQVIEAVVSDPVA